MDDPARKLRRTTRAAWLAIVLNLLLTAAKFTAGILGRSRAMIADAVESLADIPSSIVVIFGLRLGARPPDRTHDYGHGKMETLASMMVGFLLLLAGGWILASGATAVMRCLRGLILPRPGMVAFWVSLLTIVLKEWLYRFTLRVGREEGSPATMANAWHHRSDALTSLGTLAGISGSIFLGERWRVLDPLAATVISLWILRIGWCIARDGLNELLEASESDEKEDRILDIVRGTPGVSNPHRLRTRRIGGVTAVDIHVEVPGACTVNEAHRVADDLESRIRKDLGAATIVSVHIEPLGYQGDNTDTGARSTAEKH